MTSKDQRAVPELESDPFGERSPLLVRSGVQLMGGQFRFKSNSAELLRLVDAAYQDLPSHRFTGASPQFEVTLLLTPTARSARSVRHPPGLSMASGSSFLAGASDGATFAALSPGGRSALICVSPDMLRFPYHTRYEWIEFAVFTLASRAQKLVPLHAACIGLNGRGIVLMGESGAGKSTLSLQCLLENFEYLAEDSVFVSPRSLLATGTPNFLHVRTDSIAWLGANAVAALIRKSPVIERRSGVKKYELDLRSGSFRLASKPLKIAAVVFLSPKRARSPALLTPLSQRDTSARMKAEQAYGAGLPQWREFQCGLSSLGGFELRRGDHPRDGAQALRQLLGAPKASARRPR
jgi:hypothetical protein